MQLIAQTWPPVNSHSYCWYTCHLSTVLSIVMVTFCESIVAFLSKVAHNWAELLNDKGFFQGPSSGDTRIQSHKLQGCIPETLLLSNHSPCVTNNQTILKEFIPGESFSSLESLSYRFRDLKRWRSGKFIDSLFVFWRLDLGLVYQWKALRKLGVIEKRTLETVFFPVMPK